MKMKLNPVNGKHAIYIPSSDYIWMAEWMSKSLGSAIEVLIKDNKEIYTTVVDVIHPKKEVNACYKKSK